MEQNYKIYDLNDNLLEIVDELSHSSYGKPGFTKEFAIRTGKQCYFRKIPGSPKDIRTSKEVFRHFNPSDSTEYVWVFIFKDILGGQNTIVVRNESDIRSNIERLVSTSRVESEDDVEIYLRPIW